MEALWLLFNWIVEASDGIIIWIIDILRKPLEDTDTKALSKGEVFILRTTFLGIIFFFIMGCIFSKLRTMAGGMMISLGIFGTFWGIAIALQPLDFSSQETMRDSVIKLLDGMKAAFYSSLFGLGGAIISKLVWLILKFIELIIYRFIKSGSRIDKLFPKPPSPNKDVEDKLEAIKQAIAGDNDSSLAEQVKQLRTENRDGFAKLDGLSETIREALVENLQNMMKDLIDSLTDIITKRLGGQIDQLIKSIETALIEQFGKTFIEFNQAVQALKKWQEDHRQQVEQLTTAFDKSAEGISRIKNDCEAIPEIMAKLQDVIRVIDDQINEHKQHLEAFADMKRQAEESFPVIKQNLDQIGQDLQQSAAGFHQMEVTVNNGINSIMANVQSHIQSVMDNVQTSMNNVQARMEQAHQDITNIINESSEDFKGNITKMIGNMRDSMEQAQRDTNTKIQGMITESLEKLNQDIDRVTNHWGENMTSIAREYADVVERLKRGK